MTGADAVLVKPTRRGLVILAGAVVAVAFVLRFLNSGWLIILFGLGYLALGLGHVLVHRRIARNDVLGTPTLISIGLSHVIFLSAFLLQWDFGDSGGSTVTLEAVLNPRYAHAPRWLPEWLGTAGLLLVLVSWGLLLLSRSSGPIGVAALGANAISAAALAGTIVAASIATYADDQVRLEAAVSRAGGRAPASCGTLALPTRPREASDYERMVGASPVWLKVYPFTARSNDLLFDRLGDHMGSGAQTNWLVDPAFGRPITVQMRDASTGEGVRAEQFGSSGFATANTLDPAKPFYRATRTDRYLTYVVVFYIPHAGCYTVEAAWDGGSWSVPVAAGQ